MRRLVPDGGAASAPAADPAATIGYQDLFDLAWFFAPTPPNSRDDDAQVEAPPIAKVA